MDGTHRRRNSFDLSSQIGELRQISVDIGTELEYQNQLMRDVDEGIFGTGLTMDKLRNGVGVLIQKVRGDWSIWAIMIFILLTILYLYSRF
jgi:hypothetical protein